MIISNGIVISQILLSSFIFVIRFWMHLFSPGFFVLRPYFFRHCFCTRLFEILHVLHVWKFCRIHNGAIIFWIWSNSFFSNNFFFKDCFYKTDLLSLALTLFSMSVSMFASYRKIILFQPVSLIDNLRHKFL